MEEVMTECSNTVQEPQRNREVQALQKENQIVKTSQKRPNRQIVNLLSAVQEEIKFGSVIPGNICEDELTLCGLQNETLLVQVEIICHNDEFDELDEYVFSVRKSFGYDYNEKLYLACQNKQQIPLKIALKVPNVKKRCILKGTIVVYAQGFENSRIEGQLRIPITAQLEIPQITCPKMLMSNQHGFPLVRLALKTGRKIDYKIPFKNNSPLQLQLDLELIQPETLLAVYPTALTLQPNAQMMITITLKQRNFQTSEGMDINDIIVMKAKCSTIHFSFPLCVRIY